MRAIEMLEALSRCGVDNDAFEYLANGADHVLFGPDPEEQCTILFKIEDKP